MGDDNYDYRFYYHVSMLLMPPVFSSGAEKADNNTPLYRAYILVIVSVVLVECNGASITGIRMAAASSWFSWLGLLFLYGLVMVPVCRQLHQAAGCAIAKIVSIAHLGVMTVLSIIIVAFLAVLSSATETAISETVDVEIYSLADANRGLLITFDVLALIGMIMASVSMCLATTRTERFQKGSLALWIGLLIGGCLATSSFNLGGDISRLFTISTHRNTASRLLSTVFVGSFFYAWLFACVLLVVTSPALVAARAEVNARTTDGTSAPAADASSAPDFELKDSYSSPADQKAPQSYPQQQQQSAPPPPQTHH
ncbi:hypothetical protein LOZ53_002034 [Ophidiomyces ophidiicola]|nr:hypothetical protein LOZ55_003894 [Ophidiomyces ophidiicola]KAI1985000.1 hypothetical protein LOZ51_006534 [Ophidiomyces ophidiicola]KAI1987497.1 hypothetical protein LOZ54_003553 [Ophidiomyces ophidiicola]KAI1993822.1 hypothetical protein LOZ53_002034 [Ophidiomyces ophidiicola]